MGAYLAEIIPYWHRHIDQPALPAPERYRNWYQRADNDFKEHFSALVETLLAQPAGARDIPNTAASIIVLDQFPRKIYPKGEKAYSGHTLAAAIAAPLVEHGEDASLELSVRLAIAMCLSNTEDLAIHDVGLGWFEQTQLKLDGEALATLMGFKALAERRREVVRLYGHLPSRNQALGRPSTPAEAYLMVGHGYEFE